METCLVFCAGAGFPERSNEDEMTAYVSVGLCFKSTFDLKIAKFVIRDPRLLD